jgi:alanyl-tRNA synthetase
MPLSTRQIREAFLTFFATRHGHRILPSASLIPSNPTVLLTPAGMLPFVPVFMGVEPPPTPPRAVSSQKCARVSGKASDLSYVGRTMRHHTFFEMLGNFSFGDYFKEQAIPWAWQFITEELKLPKDKLYVSVFYDDKESRRIWEEVVGLSSDRVWDKDEKDNFWGPPGPTGPCGPCTEIYYDLGPQFEDPEDRYLEIWNVVCMELFKDAEGLTSPLKAKNIDTGMGLERIAMVVQGVSNTFETDLLFPIVKRLADLTGKIYKQNAEDDVALKIVTDHIRCVVFALADGVMPSNEGRGYVIRMILRRAVRYGRSLGLTEPALFKLVSTIRDLYQEPYTEVREKYDVIVETIKAEEKRFLETLDRGQKLLFDSLDTLKQSKQTCLSGDDAFKLYDTFGFPLELTIEFCQEHGFDVDEAGFQRALEAQKERARGAQGDKTIVSDQLYADILADSGPTQFVGYDTLETEGQILALIVDGKRVDTVGGTNQPFELILSRTPFYAESGGQVGDQGIVYVQNGPQAQTVVIQDVQKVGDLIIHKALYDQGESIQVGQTVQAEVAPEPRARTAAHHSATHLLHAALKQVLGEHVAQAGSLVGPKGARFDFNFQRGVTADERSRIEMLVNRWIFDNAARDTAVMSIDEAKAAGAVAMFGEKYGDAVRVVTLGEHSKELCGGTHVTYTGDIGLFRIASEGSIASGVRRMEFVVGDLALHEFHKQERLLQAISEQMKTPPAELLTSLEKLSTESKAKDKRIRELSEKDALRQMAGLLDAAQEGVLIAQVEVMDADFLKWMTEQLAQRLGAPHVVALGANIEGKAMFCASVSPTMLEKGIKASDLVKTAATMCEGGGGGKPQFAQAGGKNANKIPDALNALKAALEALQVPIR